MIEFNDNFKTKHDGRQWVLYEAYMGKAGMKDGKPTEPKEQVRESYHGTLRQACNAVIDKSAVKCDSAEEIGLMLDRTGWLLEGMAEGF